MSTRDEKIRNELGEFLPALVAYFQSGEHASVPEDTDRVGYTVLEGALNMLESELRLRGVIDFCLLFQKFDKSQLPRFDKFDFLGTANRLTEVHLLAMHGQSLYDLLHAEEGLAVEEKKESEAAE